MKTPRPRHHLVIFARNPIPGRVKTRLIPALGVESATAIYRRMLRDTLATCSRLTAERREIWIDQSDAHPDLKEMAEQLGMSMRVQSGGDLGARMHTAFVETLQTAHSAILIGTDCPGFDTPYLDAAFRALERQDAVLGPAADGGYVLIGLKVPEPSLFENIPWGTNRVLAETRRQLQRLQWNWFELPTMHDVDQPEDLLRFPHLTALAQTSPAEGSGE